MNTKRAMPAGRQGEIVTTVTFISLALLLAGVFLGRQDAVQQSLRQLTSRAQAAPTPTVPPSSLCPRANCQVRLVKDSTFVYRDQRDANLIHVDGNFCFAGEAVSGTHRGRLWFSKDAGGREVVGPVRDFTFYPGGEWPGPCDRTGVLLKNKQMTGPSAKNSFSYTVSASDFPNAACPAIYLNYISVGGGGETYSERGFVGLNPQEYGACGPITPAATITGSPVITAILTNIPVTPTPSLPAGSCPIRTLNYIKEVATVGAGTPTPSPRLMEEIDREDTGWYSMNERQREKWTTNYKPTNATENGFGYTDGQIEFAMGELPEDIVVGSPEGGRVFKYRRGDTACVKVFHEPTHRIVRVDPGPGYVSNNVTKDEVCGLPLACNQNYSYGWFLEKVPVTLTPVPSASPTQDACTLKRPENLEKCRPRVTKAETKTSGTVRVEWDKIDASCQNNSYTVQVVGPIPGQSGEYVLCQKTGVTDEGTDCRVSSLGKISDFTRGVTYTAQVYAVKNEPAACFSEKGEKQFTHPLDTGGGGGGTGGGGGGDCGGFSCACTRENCANGQTYQLDLYDINRFREGSDGFMCWSVANKARNADNVRAGNLGDFTCAGNIDGNINKLVSTYTNNTGSPVTLRWQTHRCDGNAVNCNQPPNGKDGTRSEEGFPNNVIAPNESVTCSWNDPMASIHTVICNKGTTPPDTGGNTGGGGGGNTGGGGGGGGSSSCVCQRNSSTTNEGVCSNSCDSGTRGSNCTVGSSGDSFCATQPSPTRTSSERRGGAITIAPTSGSTGLKITANFNIKNFSNSKLKNLRPIICKSTTQQDDRDYQYFTYRQQGERYTDSCLSFDNVVGDGVANTSSDENQQQSFSAEIKQKPTADAFTRSGESFKVGCAFEKHFGIFLSDLDACKLELVAVGGSKTFNIRFNLDGGIEATFALQNDTNNAISSIDMNVCGPDGTCENKTKNVSLAAGQKTTLKESFDQIAEKGQVGVKYTTSCTLHYSDGSTAACPRQSIEVDNPLYYDITARTNAPLQTAIVTEQQLADNNKDKANNAVDLARMLSNFNTAAADANRDGITNALDISIGHKWLLKSNQLQ